MIVEVIVEFFLFINDLMVNYMLLFLVYFLVIENNEVKLLECVRMVIERYLIVIVELDEKFNVNWFCWFNINLLVSLIIFMKNGKVLVKVCIELILEKIIYKNYEILFIDNGFDE